jgi:RHS repeat-associated protein
MSRFWDMGYSDSRPVGCILSRQAARAGWLRVVEQQAGGINTQIVYSPLGKIALMNGSTLVKAFVPLPGGGTAVYNSSGLAYYRHPDWLGSSRLTSDYSRALYSSSSYAPFGEQYAVTGTADPSFTGQNSDTVSSLYDFLFRRESPSQGRWISPDPLGIGAVDITDPQTWNRYAYVGNRPLSNIDPLGLVYPGSGGGGSSYFFLNNGCIWQYHLAEGVIHSRDYITVVTCTDGIGYAPHHDWIGKGLAVGANPGGGDPSAPNNGNNCSVLDPNCTKPGPLENYAVFLSCENAFLINDLGQSGAAKFGALSAGAVGVTQMWTYSFGTAKVIAKAGLKRGVPVIGEIAALYDVTMLNIKVAQANQTCTKQVYGH